jgi:hypothetical protein
MMMNDKKMKLIDKLKSRYPKLESDPLMEDLESIMYGEEEDSMGEFEDEEMPEDDMMGEEMPEEEMGMEDEEDYMTDPDEEDPEAAFMAIMGKPKGKPRRKS